MEFFKEFISNYGAELLGTIITGIAAYLGVVAKQLIEKYMQDKTVKSVAKTVAIAVEQIWKDLHGEEKLAKAMENFSDMLAEKGITISELEMRVQLEAAVGEFNKAFEKSENK